MKILSVLALLLSTVPAFSGIVDFLSSTKWNFDCVVDMQPKNYISVDNVNFTWDRSSRRAELAWPNGARKIMRQVDGNDGKVAHFWYGPETGLIEPGLKTLDCCYGALLSVRDFGEFSLTQHTIVYGGIRAFSYQGRCRMKPIK